MQLTLHAFLKNQIFLRGRGFNVAELLAARGGPGEQAGQIFLLLRREWSSGEWFG